MWSRLKSRFDGFPGQERVAQKLLGYGIRVEGGRAFCGDIEVADLSIARATGTNRRTVRTTLLKIDKDKELRKVFSNLQPICSLKSVAMAMRWGVIEILPDDVRRPGILYDVTKVISAAGISIRQSISDDPDLVPEPKAFIVT
jgi:predicted regulator of amino acid metabolism with ACT domain